MKISFKKLQEKSKYPDVITDFDSLDRYDQEALLYNFGADRKKMISLIAAGKVTKEDLLRSIAWYDSEGLPSDKRREYSKKRLQALQSESSSKTEAEGFQVNSPTRTITFEGEGVYKLDFKGTVFVVKPESPKLFEELVDNEVRDAVIISIILESTKIAGDEKEIANKAYRVWSNDGPEDYFYADLYLGLREQFKK